MKNVRLELLEQYRIKEYMIAILYDLDYKATQYFIDGRNKNDIEERITINLKSNTDKSYIDFKLKSKDLSNDLCLYIDEYPVRIYWGIDHLEFDLGSFQETLDKIFETNGWDKIIFSKEDLKFLL